MTNSTNFTHRLRAALLRLLIYLWVSPASFIGLLFVPLALFSGGSFKLVNGVIEIHGGLIERLLARGFGIGRACAAMTLGHVVLGRTQRCLNNTRAHERIHARQYERW